MKRIFLALAAAGMLVLAGSQVQAHDGYRGGAYYPRHGVNHGHIHHGHGHIHPGHGIHRGHYPVWNRFPGHHHGVYCPPSRLYYPYSSGFGVRAPGFGLWIGR